MSRPVPVVIGYGTETVIRHFLASRSYRDGASTFIDLDTAMRDPAFRLDVTDEGMTLSSGAGSTVIGYGTPIYHRFFVRPDPDPASVARLQAAYDSLQAFCEGCPDHALVISRPSAGFLNSSKMAHMRQLASIGFSVPPAVVSTQTATLAAIGGATISKGCSGVRSIARRATAQDFAHVAPRLAVPAMLQRFIPGADVRVHMVGYETVALKFTTAFDDYRYAVRAGHDLQVEACDVHPSVLPHCWSYMKAERLEFAGFDFKVDADGRWWLLEVNPMPGFSFYDRHCDGRISELLAQALGRGYSNLAERSGLRKNLICSDRLPAVDRGGTA